MTVRPLAALAFAVLALPAGLAGCSTGSSDEAGTTTTAAPTGPSDEAGTTTAAPTGSTAEADVRLTNLTSVEQLRTRFNDDRGTPRLLLLFSPT